MNPERLTEIRALVDLAPPYGPISNAPLIRELLAALDEAAADTRTLADALERIRDYKNPSHAAAGNEPYYDTARAIARAALDEYKAKP